MKKIELILAIVLILILVSLPVNAGKWNWLSDIFKTSKNWWEKQAIKTSEKELAEAEGKTLKKEEQVLVNKKAGQLLDEAFKTKWCQYNKCINNGGEILFKFNKRADEFFIINDYEANNYIRQVFDNSFTRRPDMLRVKTNVKGNHESITIYDVKTSAEAKAVAKEQADDYVSLCNNLNKKYGSGFCNVEYVLPKKSAVQVANKIDGEVASCLAIGLIAVPDPTDLLCFIKVTEI